MLKPACSPSDGLHSTSAHQVGGVWGDLGLEQVGGVVVASGRWSPPVRLKPFPLITYVVVVVTDLSGSRPPTRYQVHVEHERPPAPPLPPQPDPPSEAPLVPRRGHHKGKIRG
eukprot:1192091-Prorocentrum_minimum.AAC.2